jgi:hypothetical protein
MKRLSADPGVLVAALLPLIGILPTFGDGVIKSADAPLHTHRIYAMMVLLGSGNLWPRWVPWFHLGYGYPVFNFYPPGVFYLGGLLGLLGIPVTVAFTLIAALAWMLGSVGMYKLGRQFFPASAAVLAAMLWAYAPSRLYEVWHQGSLPQMMSAACVPWVFWGLALVARHPTRRNLLAIALPFAGMVLTHQPVTLVTGLFIAPAVLVLPFWMAHRAKVSEQTDTSSFPATPVYRKVTRRFVFICAGLLLGVGLAAIFVLPLAAELRFVAGAEETRDTIPYLISNFLQPREIFAQPLPMDLTDLRFELPTTLGLVGGVMSLFGLLALLRRRQFGLALILVVALAFMAFMLLEISLPFWERIPFLAQLRFPARLLRVGVVFIALAGGASILLIPQRWQSVGLGLGLIVALVAALPLVYPNQQFVNWDNLSALDEINMEMTEHNWGTTSYDEFDPIWGERVPLDRAPDPEQYVANPLRLVVRRSQINNLYPTLQSVEELDAATTRVIVTDDVSLQFHQYYYPGWMATLDGQPIEIGIEPGFGLITVDVPPGEHTVSLHYAGTPMQAVGALVTILSIGLSVVFYWKRSATSPAMPDERLSSRTSWIVVAAIGAFALVNTLFITPHTLWFRQQSSPDTPAYMQTPVHQSFGDMFELLGYSLEQSSAAPSALLDVELFWRAQRDIDEEYRPVVQFVNLTVSEAWAASEPFFPGGGRTIGYPVDRFASEIHSLRLNDTTPPYIGRISVQMVDSGSGAPLPLPNGSDRLILDPLIRVEGSGTAVQGTALPYILDDTIELRCAAVQPEDNQYVIDLYWRVIKSPAQDVVAFVHGLDADGSQIEQNDAPPLAGNYPASLWLPGQNLFDRHTLPLNPAITTIAVGLYMPTDGQRLNVTQADQPVTDNRILLPVPGSSCQG